MSGADHLLRRRRYTFYPGELGDIARCLAAGQLTGGSALASLEQELADYHGVSHAITANSGRVSLLLLFEALGLRAGDEILVPAYTLRALIELLAAAGYQPVPVDTEPDGWNLDPRAVAARVGGRSRALLATHLFGRPCDIRALAATAAEHRLILVEDCAQALGAEVGGVKVGSFGDGAILSFDLLKAVNTFGGGAILTRGDQVAARVRTAVAALAPAGGAVVKRVVAGLTEHTLLASPAAPLLIAALAHPATRPLIAGAYRSMQHSVRPTGARYSNLQAVIGRRLLASLDGRVAVRRAMAARLAELLGETPTGGEPGDSGYFFVRQAVGDPVTLRRDLLRAGIDAGIGAEVADYCGDLGRGAECRNARQMFQRAIQLPLHEGLDDRDLRRIAAACRGRLRPDPTSDRKVSGDK